MKYAPMGTGKDSLNNDNCNRNAHFSNMFLHINGYDVKGLFPLCVHCHQVAGSIIGKGGANISKLRNQVSIDNNVRSYTWSK